MNEYLLYYLLISFCTLLCFCIHCRLDGEPISDWDADQTTSIIFMSFVPIVGVACILCCVLWPWLTKERTFDPDKLFMNESMLKGIEKDIEETVEHVLYGDDYGH